VRETLFAATIETSASALRYRRTRPPGYCFLPSTTFIAKPVPLLLTMLKMRDNLSH
jgi:hypothetical protein